MDPDNYLILKKKNLDIEQIEQNEQNATPHTRWRLTIENTLDLPHFVVMGSVTA